LIFLAKPLSGFLHGVHTVGIVGIFGNIAKCQEKRQDFWIFHKNIIMVVRTPGKPEIHLEFENATWKTLKTWTLLLKS